MPITVYFPSDAERSGIDITYTKSTQKLSISGWYDGCVGIEGEVIDLAAFFIAFKITEKDCAKAFREIKKEAESD